MSRTLGAPAGRNEHRRGQRLRLKSALARRRDGVAQLTSATSMHQTPPGPRVGLRWILVTNNSAQLLSDFCILGMVLGSHVFYPISPHEDFLPKVTQHIAVRAGIWTLVVWLQNSKSELLSCASLVIGSKSGPKRQKGRGTGWRTGCVLLPRADIWAPSWAAVSLPSSQASMAIQGSHYSHHGSHTATARPHRPWIIEGQSKCTRDRLRSQMVSLLLGHISPCSIHSPSSAPSSLPEFTSCLVSHWPSLVLLALASPWVHLALWAPKPPKVHWSLRLAPQSPHPDALPGLAPATCHFLRPASPLPLPNEVPDSHWSLYHYAT